MVKQKNNVIKLQKNVLPPWIYYVPKEFTFFSITDLTEVTQRILDYGTCVIYKQPYSKKQQHGKRT